MEAAIERILSNGAEDHVTGADDLITMPDGDGEVERPDSLDSDESLSGPPDSDESSGEDEGRAENESSGEDEGRAENESSGEDEGRAVGFLEGGKVESFSRAFHRLVDGEGAEGSGSAPILAGSKSISKRKLEEEKEMQAAKAAKKIRDEMKQRGHYIPARKGLDPERDGREKRLQKTATKGVVQLFNAINAAQKRIRSEETKGNKGKIARLGKAGFLAEIKHMKERDGVDGEDQKSKAEEPSGWDVLKEGFVGIAENSKMKDWRENSPPSSPPSLSSEDDEEF